MQFDYSLGSMLPFARAAIRNASNFEIRQFADLLFGELEKADVSGVKRQQSGGATKFNFSDLTCPSELRSGTIEVFFHLVHRGFILPEAQSFPVAFNDMRYWKTPRGSAWSQGVDPLPEDVDGYMRCLSKLVPTLDPVIAQYVQEGLGSFHREMFFSAAVMLGAASEKEIYLLGQSLVTALKDPKAQTQLTKLLGDRSLYRLLQAIEKHVVVCANLRGVFDGALTHLMSLFESIRVQRNDAVHPNTANVDEDSVRLAYDSFPKAIEKAEALRAWCQTNPGCV
jgi:hypothetical protein